ncbi:MAG: aminodeoxychorismate synthase component I [Bacteroidetes bacterium]|nr:aminodeoxychorismate synthase component I [Bacteroidota bacterium]
MQKPYTLIEKVNALARQHIPFVFIVDFEMHYPKVYTLDELSNENIELFFPTYQTKEKLNTSKEIFLKKMPISFVEYTSQFNTVKQNLLYGNSFLCNLTCQTSIELNASLDEVFHSVKAKYTIKYKDEWVCFSPETFVRIEDGIISSYPMKGTIDASLPNAIDTILHDAKELAEHYTIVDLIRNDLALVATDIEVKKFRYIDKIVSRDKSLYQVSSHIEGKLPVDYLDRLGDILFTLLPAGSISGAPKKKTIEIIKEAENYERGFYTGTTFYFDGQNIDSCVLIRFIEKTESGIVYKSGGGITIHSEVEKEYQELIDKVYVPTI